MIVSPEPMSSFFSACSSSSASPRSSILTWAKQAMKLSSCPVATSIDLPPRSLWPPPTFSHSASRTLRIWSVAAVTVGPPSKMSM
jgi:hypothetical protein